MAVTQAELPHPYHQFLGVARSVALGMPRAPWEGASREESPWQPWLLTPNLDQILSEWMQTNPLPAEFLEFWRLT